MISKRKGRHTDINGSSRPFVIGTDINIRSASNDSMWFGRKIRYSQKHSKNTVENIERAVLINQATCSVDDCKLTSSYWTPGGKKFCYRHLEQAKDAMRAAKLKRYGPS